MRKVTAILLVAFMVALFAGCKKEKKETFSGPIKGTLWERVDEYIYLGIHYKTVYKINFTTDTEFYYNIQYYENGNKTGGKAMNGTYTYEYPKVTARVTTGGSGSVPMSISGIDLNLTEERSDWPTYFTWLKPE